MKISIKDTLTLDNNIKYIVISNVNYCDKNYYYLINQENNTDIKFCYEDNDELVEIEDNELTTRLLPLFLESTKKEIIE